MSEDDLEIGCSFCNGDRRKVRKLFASADNRHCICDVCIDLCASMLHDDGEEPATRPEAAPVIPSPREIKRGLDDYVIDQDDAKRALAVAVHNHYKRHHADATDGIELDKANVLLCGPTGVGKTLLAETLARQLAVPFATADATALTEAGYIGEAVEAVLTRLLQAADMDIARAEHGIVFIDEIDKKTIKELGARPRDVSGEGVQQALLKLIEGADVMVPSPLSGRGPGHPDMIRMNTRNILFILGGAFVGLDKVIARALHQDCGSVGFNSVVGAPERETVLLRQVQPEHLVTYGLIPELVGRLPVICVLDDFDEAQLVRILSEPRNALTKQFAKLFRLGGVELLFEPAALRAIARIAQRRKTGARALRSVIEQRLMQTQYELPELRAAGVRRIVVTAATIEGATAPTLVYEAAG